MVVSRQEEYEALRTLLDDNARLESDVKKYREQANNAINNISHLTEERDKEQKFRLDAESFVAREAARVSQLEQDVGNLQTAINLLQAQKAYLEEEKTTLGQQNASLHTEMASRQKVWEENEAQLISDGAKAEKMLTDQTNLRMKMQDDRDQIQEDLAISAQELDEARSEKERIQKRLETAQGSSLCESLLTSPPS